MDEKKLTDIGLVLTQSQNGDEVTLFMKSLNGDRIEVESVIEILAAIDIKEAMSKMYENKTTTHPMPKGVM